MAAQHNALCTASLEVERDGDATIPHLARPSINGHGNEKDRSQALENRGLAFGGIDFGCC